MLNVQLLAHTPNAEKIVASSAKLCYSSSNIDTLMDDLTPEKAEKFLEKLMSMGHESPIEHVTFTFGIEGVSRSLLAQFTRHRIASYSVQSQRYVQEKQFEYVIPTAIKNMPEAKELFIKSMTNDQIVYDQLTEMLKNKYITKGMTENLATKKAIEDARYVLPNACETKIIATFNARSLYNFFHHRCCNRAQDEIRELATQMLFLVRDICPTLFKNAGSSCINGKCPEGKMSCGKMKEMQEKFKENK